MNDTPLKIAFFGTPDIAVWVLTALKSASFAPSLIITNPDTPKGRKMLITPTPAKIWAEENNIPVAQPETLHDEAMAHTLRNGGYDLFIVAAYGKIIPQSVLDIPKFGTLNVHPSLLPKLRGASPIRSAILGDMRKTGVTIMLMDEKLDHGPILAQEVLHIAKDDWPLRGQTLDELLARHGGTLLADVIPKWMSGEIEPTAQDHAQATFCTKITKEMGEIDLAGDSHQNLLKIRAFDGWPGTYFFQEKNGTKIRVKIIDAELDTDGSLKILRVIPEGKKEMSYADFLRN